MALQYLDFLNKNQFRRFPFKSGTTLTSMEGRVIPDALFNGVSITIVNSQSRDDQRVYLRQLYVRAPYISAVFSTFSGSILGVFSGELGEDISNLKITQFSSTSSGMLSVGTVEVFKDLYDGIYNFYPEATEIEESTIFEFTAPGVSSIRNGRYSLSGFVEFGSLDNLTRATDQDSSTISLQVTNTVNITSIADLSSCFDNCPTPAIYQINTTTPYTVEEDTELAGNVFIYGISPIVIQVDPLISGVMKLVSENVTLSSLCVARQEVLPPTDTTFMTDDDRFPDTLEISSLNNYYTKAMSSPYSFVGTSAPEFLIWPTIKESLNNGNT